MSEDNISVPDPLKEQQLRDRPLPAPDICRAQQMIATLVECLVPEPNRCRYAVPFGDGFFCYNPGAKLIAAKTKAGEKKSDGK